MDTILFVSEPKNSLVLHYYTGKWFNAQVLFFPSI